MTFVQIEKRNGMIGLDGYSRRKTLKGALKDLGREVAKIDEGEGKCILDYIDETAKMVADGMPNEPFAYYIEAQEVSCASRYKFLNGDEDDFSEENVEMEYAEGNWYLYIRFCAPEPEAESADESEQATTTEQTAEAAAASADTAQAAVTARNDEHSKSREATSANTASDTASDTQASFLQQNDAKRGRAPRIDRARQMFSYETERAGPSAIRGERVETMLNYETEYKLGWRDAERDIEKYGIEYASNLVSDQSMDDPYIVGYYDVVHAYAK